MDTVTDAEAERAEAGAAGGIPHREVENRHPSALMSVLKTVVRATTASTPLNSIACGLLNAMEGVEVRLAFSL